MLKVVGNNSPAELERDRKLLSLARRTAIATSNLKNIDDATRAAEQLGRQLIAATRRVTRLLQWRGRAQRWRIRWRASLPRSVPLIERKPAFRALLCEGACAAGTQRARVRSVR